MKVCSNLKKALLARVSNGIDRLIVYAELIVDVRPRGTASASSITDKIAALDALALLNRDARQMAVAAGDSISMIDGNQIAVA